MNGFNISKFSYSQKAICHPQINTCSAAAVLHKLATVRWKTGAPQSTRSQAQVEQGKALPSHFSKCPFQVLFNDFFNVFF